MVFELNEEQRIIQEQARRFAEKEILPTLREEEANHEFRPDRVRKMGELGFLAAEFRRSMAGTAWGSWSQ